MSDLSARLGMPYLMPAQAQKHVTHNEALTRLDLLVQMVVQEFDAAAPPALPLEGQIWALGPAPSGAWAGRAGELAAQVEGTWQFITPQQGWQATRIGQDGPELRIFTAAGWVVREQGQIALDNLPGLGIGTSHDSINRLAVSAEATLLNHEGADHQLKINKAHAADTASLLFQTAFSGRAEMGTTGDDNWSIKVSADGATWLDGMVIDTTTGAANLPNGLDVTGQIAGTAVTQSSTDITSGRLMRVGDFGLGETGNAPDGTDMRDGNHPVGWFRAASGVTQNRGDAPYGDVFYTYRVDNIGGSRRRFTLFRLNDKSYFRDVTDDGPFPWRMIWDGSSTTVDSNGFVKEASPIVRLFADGIEEPVLTVGATFERLGVGEYCLTHVEPLAGVGWQIEVPQDGNGNRLVFVATKHDPSARTLTIKTAEPDWQGGWVAGAPKDIPEGRWVDLRFQHPPDTDEPGV